MQRPTVALAGLAGDVDERCVEDTILGKGTSIQLTFPRIKAAGWIADKLRITEDSLILILDDEESIHVSWELRFDLYTKLYPTLRLHHFTQGHKLLEFASQLTVQEKSRAVFLCDYELLRQERNGMQIIEASQIRQAVLVTSYYANFSVQNSAARLGVRILPKHMASALPIYIVP